jgi:hypothetical protein
MWVWLAMQMTLGTVQAETLPIDVSFHGDRGPVVRIRATSEPVALPACRAVSWERWNPKTEQFVLLSEAPCGPMAPAIWVDQQGRDWTAPEELGLVAGDRVRVQVVVGLGCNTDRPLPLEVAGCSEIVQVLGALGDVK